MVEAIKPLVKFIPYHDCPAPTMQPLAQFVCGDCDSKCGITCTDKTDVIAVNLFMDFCIKCNRRHACDMQ